MAYHQITPAERYTLSVLRKQGLSNAAIARMLGRHRSTVGREVRRNSRQDGGYRPDVAQEKTNGRRRRSRRNSQFGDAEWKLIEMLVRDRFSPEQISGWLELLELLDISHQTIYRRIRQDRKRGGTLWQHLRQRVRYRKRYGTREKRGRLAGTRHISIVGGPDQHCMVTLVERATGVTLIGKLRCRKAAAVNKRVIDLILSHAGLFKTITVDNGPEFHSYEDIERATGVTFYFATPYASWERGTNENTNGLIRQYVPKRTSMKRLTQHQCDAIARALNNRPRKRHGFRTPLDCLPDQFAIA